MVKASEGGAIKYSIVRPTAFFKSVSGKRKGYKRGGVCVFVCEKEREREKILAESSVT